MGIKSITPTQVLNSRGEPTLKVTITSEGAISSSFAVPSGVSIGSGEAQKKTDETSSYNGQSIMSCVELINRVIAPKFIGYPLGHQNDFDSLLVALDGTTNKENLGANTVLALSGAYFKLSAKLSKKPLWQYIAEQNNYSPNFPKIFANLVGGGKHAPGLEIQEFMIIPQTNKPVEAVEQIVSTFNTLKTILVSLYGPNAQLVGDEGALAPTGARTEVILEALHNLGSKSEKQFEIALDVAANSFFNGNDYTFEGQRIHADGLLKIYEQLETKFNLYSIEDPFAENDLEGMELIKTYPKDKRAFKIFSDDFTVTSSEKIAQYANDKIFDGVIIKPDQVGTISEMFNAIKTAKDLSQEIIVSHRSGETNDSFIVDLAYGVGANGIKIGAPCRGERIAKYNRLLNIAYSLESNQPTPMTNISESIKPMRTASDSTQDSTITKTPFEQQDNTPKNNYNNIKPTTDASNTNPSLNSASLPKQSPLPNIAPAASSEKSNPIITAPINPPSPPPTIAESQQPTQTPTTDNQVNMSSPKIQHVITSSNQSFDHKERATMRTNMPTDLAKSLGKNPRPSTAQDLTSPL